MYKLVATDLDGTLLNSKKTITPEMVEVLHKLNNLGVIFVPSTGRTHKELPKPVKELDFLNYGLCVNGGVLYDYKKQEYLQEITIKKERVVELLEFLKDLPVYPSVIIEGSRYVIGDENDEIVDYVKSIAVKDILAISYGCFDLKKKVIDIGKDVEKLLLYPQSKELRDPCMEKISKAFPDLEVCTSGPLYIEINKKGINKGQGLRKLCEILNIEIEDTIAFGDAENDIALLDAAGKAVVMENGNDATKAHADDICGHCDDDGLRKYLEKIYKL